MAKQLRYEDIKQYYLDGALVGPGSLGSEYNARLIDYGYIADNYDKFLKFTLDGKYDAVLASVNTAPNYLITVNDIKYTWVPSSTTYTYNYYPIHIYVIRKDSSTLVNSLMTSLGVYVKINNFEWCLKKPSSESQYVPHNNIKITVGKINRYFNFSIHPAGMRSYTTEQYPQYSSELDIPIYYPIKVETSPQNLVQSAPSFNAPSSSSFLYNINSIGSTTNIICKYYYCKLTVNYTTYTAQSIATSSLSRHFGYIEIPLSEIYIKNGNTIIQGSNSNFTNYVTIGTISG